MAKQKVRIRLKAYDHKILDQSARQIVEAAERTSRLAVAAVVDEGGDPLRDGPPFARPSGSATAPNRHLPVGRSDLLGACLKGPSLSCPPSGRTRPGGGTTSSLPSIASVSHFVMRTRARGRDSGTEIRVNGGAPVAAIPASTTSENFLASSPTASSDTSSSTRLITTAAMSLGTALPIVARLGTEVPAGSAFSQARKLLGEHAMRRLFELDAERPDAELGITARASQIVLTQGTSQALDLIKYFGWT